MKSTLKNMVLVLFTITLVASAGVGVVNMITKEPIEASELKAKSEALAGVLPAFDATEQEVLTINDMAITVHTAKAAGDVVGYAVETMSKNGFGGAVTMMVGFSPEGEVLNVNVLKQTETPGLGTKQADEGNPLQTSGTGQTLKDVNLAVNKDGGDVDALTAATISSRAYVDAVARAWEAFKSVTTGVAPSDVASGASQTDAASGATATAADGGKTADTEVQGSCPRNCPDCPRDGVNCARKLESEANNNVEEGGQNE